MHPLLSFSLRLLFLNSGVINLLWRGFKYTYQLTPFSYFCLMKKENEKKHFKSLLVFFFFSKRKMMRKKWENMRKKQIISAIIQDIFKSLTELFFTLNRALLIAHMNASCWQNSSSHPLFLSSFSFLILRLALSTSFISSN